MGETNIIPIQELWLKMGEAYAQVETYWWDSIVIIGMTLIFVHSWSRALVIFSQDSRPLSGVERCPLIIGSFISTSIGGILFISYTEVVCFSGCLYNSWWVWSLNHAALAIAVVDSNHCSSDCDQTCIKICMVTKFCLHYSLLL